MEKQPYEYKAWPSYCTGPNGERAKFDSADEMPEGWVKGNERPAKGSASIPEDDERVQELIDNNTADDLLGMVEAMAEADESIEFSKSWPKLRLAQTIVAHGGPITE